MNDRQNGRFILVTLDTITGCHQLHNFPTTNFANCGAIYQGLAAAKVTEVRLLLKAHDTDIDKAGI